MALIKCPECNKEVSDSAASCPNCGYGIKEYIDKIQEEIDLQKLEEELEEKQRLKEIEEIERFQRRLDSMTMPKKWRFPFISFIVIMLIWFFLCKFFLEAGEGLNILTFAICAFITFVSVAFLSGIYKSYEENNDYYELAIRDFEAYKLKKIQDDDKKRAQDEAEYNQKMKEKMSKMVKCPTCNSYNTKAISTASRVVSVGMVGLASSKIGKTMECKNCGYKW